MMEYQSAHAGFRLHHHAFRQLHADLIGIEQLPDALLVVQVRACRIPEAVSFATISGSEPLLHRHARRIGEAPVLAYAAVDLLGATFRSLDRQRLDRVGPEELPVCLRGLGPLANALARCHNEQGDVVAIAVRRIEDVVAQAQDRPSVAGVRNRNVWIGSLPPGSNRWIELPVALRLEELPYCADLHPLQRLPPSPPPYR